MADPAYASKPEAAAFLATQPIPSAALGGMLTISTSTASTTNNLPAGVYVCRLDKTGGVLFVAWASSATLPTTGADIASNQICVGDGDLITAPGGQKLSAILSGSGFTGTLGYTQLAA